MRYYWDYNWKESKQDILKYKKYKVRIMLDFMSSHGYIRYK